jgi:ankyrin repeat protein
MCAAASSLNPDILTALLRSGADISIRASDGRTARDFAMDNAALEGTEVLRDLDIAGRRGGAAPARGGYDR